MTDALSAAEPATHWDLNAAFWVQIIRQHRDKYRTELTDAAVWAAIGDCAELDVLDVGCGEGYMAREALRRGARRVHGIDMAADLVAAARASGGDGVSFDEADAAHLPFGPGSFDLVMANHVLNDLPDITTPISEFARVLRPGGRLVALMLHPCFYGYRAERTTLRRALPVTEYFAPRAIEQHFEVDGLTSPVATITWVRPLEAYFQALAGGGLHVIGLTEPHPSEEQIAGSQWWQENFTRPLFLLISALKP